MLPKSQRISSGQDIITVLRKGRRWKTSLLTCSFIQKPGRLGRVAVIISTKVSKKAVTRNRLRRQIQAIVRLLGLPGGDLVVRLEKAATNASFADLQQQLEVCFSKLR